MNEKEKQSYICITTNQYYTRCGAPRIRAVSVRGRIYMSPRGRTDLDCHRFAAHTLIEKFVGEDYEKHGDEHGYPSSFHHNFVSGSTEEGYCHVLLERSPIEDANWRYHYEQEEKAK